MGKTTKSRSNGEKKRKDRPEKTAAENDRHRKTERQNGQTTTSAAPHAAKVKRKREVVEVVCPSAFPDFSSVGGGASGSSSRRRPRREDAAEGGASAYEGRGGYQAAEEIDFQTTVREVHKLGAEGFTGRQAASHRYSEYERLTGRAPKRQKMPAKMVALMRKRASERDERQKRELEASGVVTHKGVGGEKKKRTERGMKKKVISGRDHDKSHDGAGPGVVRGAFGTNRARNKGERRVMKAGKFGPAPDVGFMAKGMLRVKKPD